MAEYLVKKDALGGFFQSLVKDGHKLLAPVLDNGQWKMAETTPDKVTLEYTNTHLSPKDAFFPQTERLMAYHNAVGKDGAFIYQDLGGEVGPRVMFGLRPCDARGLAVANRVFQNDRFTDPYWKVKYESTVKIGLACHNPCPQCFCTSMEGGPFSEEGLDVLAAVKDGSLLLKTVSQAGDDFLKKLNLAAASVTGDLEALAKEAVAKMPPAIDMSKIAASELLALMETPHWADTADRCLNCGVCTFVCPTCHCFDIQDEQSEKGGVRMRNWDSCMNWLFTIHGTGHNPRPSKMERVRQRFMHKLKYIPLKQDGHCGCIGCGRCVTLCPVNIDVREVARQMNTGE